MYLEHDELDEVVTQERTWALFAHDIFKILSDAVESNDKNKIIFCEAEIIRMGQLIDGYQKKEKKYA
jgi:hypothetical protein|tara:strand:- start:10647 stop:10847 length:201 start_codon:yes stop_codon:yes gene_type:complete